MSANVSLLNSANSIQRLIQESLGRVHSPERSYSFHKNSLGGQIRPGYHGQTVAHIDTWCHFFVDGQMYNGTPVKDNITPETGCKKGSVMNWKDGIVTRAVLYDIAQLKGADWVEPGVPVTRADLETWEKKSGVKAGPGDVPLLYIGRWKRREKMGPWTGQVSGYYADTIPWMHERLPAS